MRYFFLLLIVVPAIEIGILLFSGKVIGVLLTVGLIILTGFLGAYLAKRQGLETLKKARLDMEYGHLPREVILDGVCVLVGAIFLLTPGFVTDIFGFFLLLPATRKYIKKFLRKAILKWFERGNITIIK